MPAEPLSQLSVARCAARTRRLPRRDSRMRRRFTMLQPAVAYRACYRAIACMARFPHWRTQMSDIKKDHSIGEGTGAVAGAVTGAAVGSVAGPAGTVVGSVVGGALGAKAGDNIAEAVNPTEYSSYFQ